MCKTVRIHMEPLQTAAPRPPVPRSGRAAPRHAGIGPDASGAMRQRVGDSDLRELFKGV